jgi:membrane-associated phospholipid phosphatase
MRAYLSAKARKIWASIALLSVELIIILVLFVCSLLGFAYLVNRIIRLQRYDFDMQAFEYISRFVNDTNTGILYFITFFATHTFLIPANLVLIAYFLFIKKHRWYSIKVPVVALGSVTVMASLKLLFSRPRPLTPLLAEVGGFSFPSGHAMSSVTFYGLLIYLVWHNISNKWAKWILIGLLLLIIVLIGFSRIYLRVHYLSDVLAGFAMGTVWLVLSVWVMGRVEKYTGKKIAPEVAPTTYV